MDSWTNQYSDILFPYVWPPKIGPTDCPDPIHTRAFKKLILDGKFGWVRALQEALNDAHFRGSSGESINFRNAETQIRMARKNGL